METKIISMNQEDACELTLQTLYKSGVVAFPTDTVYGIGCLISDQIAVERLFIIKGRDLSKAIPILLGDISQIEQIAPLLNQKAMILAQHYWPGALTLIVPKLPDLLKIISPYPTVAVRIPKHTWLQSLIIKSGPLAVTSANLSDMPPARTAKEVITQLDSRIELVIDGEECSGGVPSSIVDCSISEVKVLREGAISEKEIRCLTK